MDSVVVVRAHGQAKYGPGGLTIRGEGAARPFLFLIQRLVKVCVKATNPCRSRKKVRWPVKRAGRRGTSSRCGPFDEPGVLPSRAIVNARH
jgi:hypothetical protein